DYLPGNETFENLVAAAVDSLDASVGVGAADPVLLHVAPAPVKLDAAVSHLVLELRRPPTRSLNIVVPARPWLRHGDGADAFPSSHSGDEPGDLLLGAVVQDVRHDDVGVDRPARPAAVGVAP
ncbi:hypothetical protein EGW08_013314, partial [Elysia chlorotica]